MNPVELKKVNYIIDKEIRYLSKFYTYKIKDFKDTGLLHARSMLVFKDHEEKLTDKQATDRQTTDKQSYDLTDDFSSRIINLMAGIELLAIGLNLHTFNVDDFIRVSDLNNRGNKNNRSSPSEEIKNPVEKNYTVDLLFGDVFYSRAVIYILEYGDFHIFNSILDSLKLAHRSRLDLHQRLMEYSKQKGESFISLDGTGINSLLKTSFFTGYGIFLRDEKIKLPYGMINDLVYLKTLNDIEAFFSRFPESFESKFELKANKAHINEKSNSIKNDLPIKIGDLEPSYIRDNLDYLQNLY